MYLKIFRSSILAGICISLGGAVYLSVGGVTGAVLFSFGLLAVVHFGYRLYTGTAGFISAGSGRDWAAMGTIILGNAVGCALTALLVHYAMPSCVEAAGSILSARLEKGILPCGALGIGCGFIMTAAVKFARENKYLPLLFGVPMFILCGFTHSIADAFYYFAAPSGLLFANIGKVALLWLAIVAGNFIGCNLSRAILPYNTVCAAVAVLILSVAAAGPVEAADKKKKEIQKERIELGGTWRSTLGNCRLPGVPGKLLYGYPEVSRTDRNGREKWVMYHKSIVFPSSMKGKRIRLVMERARESTLWVDGDSIGCIRNSALPHVYDLPDVAGRNVEIALKTVGGVYGDFYAEASDSTCISGMEVVPDRENRTVTVALELEAVERCRSYIKIGIESVNGENPGHITNTMYEKMLEKGHNRIEIKINTGDFIEPWSEFHPALYRVNASIAAGNYSDNASKTFGMRSISFADNHMLVNGNRVLLRVKDFHLSEDDAKYQSKKWWWKKQFAEGRESGVNFWNMGEYSPVESAFEAADEEGIYIGTKDFSVGMHHPSLIRLDYAGRLEGAGRPVSGVTGDGRSNSLGTDGHHGRIAPVMPVAFYDRTELTLSDTVEVAVSVANYTEKEWDGVVGWRLTAGAIEPATQETMPEFSGRMYCTAGAGETVKAGRVSLPVSMFPLKPIETCLLTLTLTLDGIPSAYQFRVVLPER